MSIFTIPIDSNGENIYTQIYRYIRSEIESRRLAQGTKLPSTRLLASHLQVSRNTIDMAYGQLLDEGYIESRPKSGYYVCEMDNHLSAIPVTKTVHPSRNDTGEDIHYKYIFSPNGIDLSNFPYSTWKKIMKDILYNDENGSIFQLPPPQGDLEFRRSIANYLHQSRGVNCTEEQIIVGAGVDYLLLLLSQILGQNQIYAIENPGYRQAYRVLSKIGRPINPVGLDESGMSVKELEKTDSTIAYVTPSHQFPLGIIMPVKRRYELLSWAGEKENRYIIEDDYDSEFRYRGNPIPSLQGMDKHHKVIYTGTFSKAIAPSIRIGYIVLPPGLLQKYYEQFTFYTNTVSRTEQQLLTRFINDGFFERHLNRMRKVYKTKRDLIVEELMPYSSLVDISGANAGLHILLTFKNHWTEDTLIQKAGEHGIKITGLSEYYIQPVKKDKKTVLIGYAQMDLDTIRESLSILKKIWF